MGWRCWWNGRWSAVQTTVVQRRSPWRTRITKIQVQQKNGWSWKASWTTSCWESITCLSARNLKIKFQICSKPTRKQEHPNHQRVEGFPKTHGGQDASKHQLRVLWRLGLRLTSYEPVGDNQKDECWVEKPSCSPQRWQEPPFHLRNVHGQYALSSSFFKFLLSLRYKS